MTVKELRQAIDDYLTHGEEDDDIVIKVRTTDGRTSEVDIDHDHYAFGLRVGDSA